MSNPISLNETSGTFTVESTCVDDTGRGFPHDLSIDYKDHWFWALNGSSKSSGSGGFLSWDYNGYSMGGTAAHVAASTVEPTDNTTLSSMLAWTNPSRPSVDVPVFLYELKDIPDLLKSWASDIQFFRGYFSAKVEQRAASHLPRRLAEKNLEWQFGVAPFYSDLVKILQVQKSMDKKIRMLHRLKEGRSAGGLAVVWEDATESGAFTGYVSPLYQEENTYSFTVETTYKKWGSCVWKPSVQLPPMSDADIWWKAFRLSTGLDISLSTLYEAMPWSWLIDWFTNVGDVVASYRNAIPCSHDGSCIMLHVRTRFKKFSQTGGGGQIGLVVNRSPLRDTKLRKVVGSASPLAEFNLGLFSPKQLSILGSLAVTRRTPAGAPH